MPSVEDVARSALGDLAVPSGNLLDAERWVNDRYAELAATMRLRQLRRLGELTIPPVITTGTVTVTQNSTTVTGNDAATVAWNIGIENRFFQIDRVWYRIGSTNIANNKISLTEPYAGDTATGTTYKIASHLSLLPERCRFIIDGAFHSDRWGRTLELRSLAWLDLRSPERFYVLGGPTFVADRGEDLVTRRRAVEFYPYSDQPEHLRFGYYEAPPRLSLDDQLPASIDQDALKEGVLIDVMRFKMAQAADRGDVNTAALWRNEYRAQTTLWQNVMVRMRNTDQIAEDTAWLTKNLGGFGGRGASDITTARDEIYARGQRP